MKLFSGRRALQWLIAVATFVGCLGGSAAAQVKEDEAVTGLAALMMAKTHDESCDVLDSRARADFRKAVYAWIQSLKDDEAAKTRMWKTWNGTGADETHDCAQNAYLSVVLWTFRDSSGEDPRAQFKFLMRAKNYELKCHVLPSAGLQAFYQAGLEWIGKSGATALLRAAMMVEWQKATGSESADCEKDSLINFMVTWTFRGKSGG